MKSFIKISTVGILIIVSACAFAETSSTSSIYPQQNSTTKPTETNVAPGTTTTTTVTQSNTATVDDASITSTIQNKLSTEPMLKNQKIEVMTSGGIVTLSGTFNTDQQASKAVEIAESTPGVKDVNTSNLKTIHNINPLSDTIITAKIKGIFLREKLFGNVDVPLTTINVETNQGVVTLTGSADDAAQVTKAISLARSVNEVKNVESKIIIRK